jgi:putative ABC transport system substrate-binding protein
MVMDPDFQRTTSKNMVGVSLEIPAKIQFAYIRRVLPDCKRVGVIYNQPENEKIVREAQREAAALGLILKPFPIRSPREIPKIRDLKVDILWMVPDYIMSRRPIIKRMLLSSLREKIPLMGYSWNYARGGALLALACDYKDVGRQSAEMAVNILKGKDDAGPRVQSPREIKLYLNQGAADRLGIEFPGKIIPEVDKIFGK